MLVQEFTALVVCTDINMRTILTTLARTSGVAKVDEAITAGEALERMRLRTYHCAVVDLTDQPDSSTTFVKHLRTAPDTPDPHVAVIVVVPYSGGYKLRAAIDAGADEVLATPVSASAFLSRIMAIARLRRPFVTAPNFKGPDRRRGDDPKYRGPWRRADDRVTDGEK